MFWSVGRWDSSKQYRRMYSMDASMQLSWIVEGLERSINLSVHYPSQDVFSCSLLLKLHLPFRCPFHFFQVGSSNTTAEEQTEWTTRGYFALVPIDVSYHSLAGMYRLQLLILEICTQSTRWVFSQMEPYKLRPAVEDERVSDDDVVAWAAGIVSHTSLRSGHNDCQVVCTTKKPLIAPVLPPPAPPPPAPAVVPPRPPPPPQVPPKHPAHPLQPPRHLGMGGLSRWHLCNCVTSKLTFGPKCPAVASSLCNG